jgi:RNA polymerase sigma-B factor
MSETSERLDPRQEALLRRFSQTRDPELREQLTRHFMPLARSLALRYRGGIEPLEDLVQVANLGLVRALDGYDPGRGQFTAYAVPTILGELRRHFRDRVWNVHLPRRLQELAMNVNTAIEKLGGELGHSPTVAEIARHLEAAEDEVLDALQADNARRTLSLDAPRSRETGQPEPVIETVGSSEPGYDAVESQLAAGSAELDDREQLVLHLRFEHDLTQREIGERLDISQMQVSRIMRRALGKLLSAVRGEP